MKGLELSEKFYLEHGAPMLHKSFPEIEGLIAVGLVGSGSECFGFDDDISTDHDFEPAFCLFLPDEDIIDRNTAFALERAYSKLPKEFMGYKRNSTHPVGGSRHGVIRISDFMTEKTGSATGELSINDWFFVPEQSLKEATNGKIFRDDSGVFTKIRQGLEYMPNDVRLKKLAGNLLIMGQAGQYNYIRSINRGDTGAAQLCAIEFTRSAIKAIFLLNKTYIPYYKWCFYELKNLPKLNLLAEPLEHLISSPNNPLNVDKKQKLIEQICADIIAELKCQELTNFDGTQIEGHAYSVNNKITDSNIRNLHILYAV